MLLSPEQIRTVVNGRGSAARWQQEIYKGVAKAAESNVVEWMEANQHDPGVYVLGREDEPEWLLLHPTKWQALKQEVGL